MIRWWCSSPLFFSSESCESIFANLSYHGEEVIKKYVKNLNGLLKEVNKIGDYFLAWKGFPQPQHGNFSFRAVSTNILIFKNSHWAWKSWRFGRLAFPDDEDVIIEFEAYSSNFKKEGHDTSKCNLIVC